MGTAPPVTDSHCHLDQFDDVAGVIARARSAGVTRVVLVTFMPSHYARLVDGLGAQDGVELALGLHPLALSGQVPFIGPIDIDEELRLLAQYAPRARVVGEIGIDLSQDGKASRAEQERTLAALLQTPGVANKVLSLHNRDAVPEVVALVRAANARRPVLHSYAGTLQQLDDALDAGCSLSINPSMLTTDVGRAVIAALPGERVLVESDGPFRLVDDVALEPADVNRVHGHLAELWHTTPSEAAAVVAANTARLLGA